jgi:DNA polymerase III subunit epsilon
MSQGISAYLADTLLTERALDFLAGGPADAVTLIEHVCQLPGAPRVVAEQMAIALFADRPQFACDAGGRWWLAAQLPPAAREVEPSVESASSAQSVHVDELAALSYAVVDVETTGMSARHDDRITEVAVVVVRGGVVAETFETLVNPERPIPPMITALTNISWEMVKDAPTFREICQDLVRMLEGHVFVAHNAEFDWRFVTSELARVGYRLSGRRLCTVRLARRVLPQLRSRCLDSVAHYYGVDILARHRAAGDAVATAKILLRLLDEARGRDCRCWDDLQRLLGTRSVAKRSRRAPAMPRPVDLDTSA